MTYLLKNGNLEKLLRKPQKYPFPDIIGTFMGRDALSLGISLLELKSQDTVLLPAYLCKEVLRPFQGKTKILFYDINPDMSVDPEVIRYIVGKNAVKVLMIINYFGFLQPYRKEIRKICDEYGIELMEDCAHSLLTDESGTVGDYCIYSFRKTLPVPDGGGLKIKDGKNKHNFRFYPALYSNILSLLVITKSALNIKADSLSRAGFADKKENISVNKTKIDKSAHNLQISSFSKNGIGNLSFQEIILKRRNDFTNWLEFTNNADQIIPVLPDLSPGVCPLGFPVMVKNRDMIRSSLRERGISLKVHWNLPQEVGPEYANSHSISQNSITLPLHFDWDGSEKKIIEKMLVS